MSDFDVSNMIDSIISVSNMIDPIILVLLFPILLILLISDVADKTCLILLSFFYTLNSWLIPVLIPLFKTLLLILYSGQPPDDLLRDAKDTDKFFKHVGSIYRLEDDEVCKGIASAYRVLTEEEYEAVSLGIIMLNIFFCYASLVLTCLPIDKFYSEGISKTNNRETLLQPG